MKTELAHDITSGLSDERIREQLELLVQDHVFRASKRSVEFLRYVVEQTLKGAADEIKERTIGVEVFGRVPSYDTNMDHVVRTAAIELRKRVAIYYGEEEHRSELRVSLVPGSYIPRFTQAVGEAEVLPEPVAAAHDSAAEIAVVPITVPKSVPVPVRVAGGPRWKSYGAVVVLLVAMVAAWGYSLLHPRTAEDAFWKPVLDTPGAVLLAVGDVPNGPPTSPPPDGSKEDLLPTLHAAVSPSVPFADTVTIARVVGALEAHGKKVLIRPESTSSFSDLREGPSVLIGAFNNEWSLRLTHTLRYTLALDPDRHLIYIKDVKNPGARTWSWRTDQPAQHPRGAGAPVFQDYALISRIWNSDTGHVVIVIGGLYTYGTQAAGEFLTDPQLMQSMARQIPPEDAHKNLQIVLGTTVTDDTPGPPRVLAVSVE